MNIEKILHVVCITLISCTLSAPHSVSALSCLSPYEYIDDLVTQADTMIFSGEITNTTSKNEHVTDLTISVSKAFKGDLPETTNVQYEYDETWGYLCTNAPEKIGSTETFITRPSDGEAPYVIYSFGLDSELHTLLMAAITEHQPAGAIVSNPDPLTPEPSVANLITREQLIAQLRDLIKELLQRLQIELLPTEPTTLPNAIIGMTVAEAEDYAATTNVAFRIGMADGELHAVTMDYVPGRITATVENMIVTSFTTD